MAPVDEWVYTDPDTKESWTRRDPDEPGISADRRPKSPGVSIAPRDGPPPAWSTISKVGFLKDPETQLRAFAEARFPDDPNARNRYGMVEGEVVYVGDDGQTYREIPSGMLNQVREFLGRDVAGNVLPLAGEVGGLAVGGPVGGAVGAAAGGAAKRYVAQKVWGEPGGLMDVAGEAALQGGASAVGSGVGALVGLSARRAASGRTAARVARMASPGEDLTRLADPAIPTRITEADRFGIGSTIPEAVDDPSLSAKFFQLGQHPQTAQAARELQRARSAEVSEAFRRLSDEVSPRGADIVGVGRRAVAAADDFIKSLRQAAQQGAAGDYAQAYATAGPVDTGPVLHMLGQAMTEYAETHPARGILGKVSRILQKTERTVDAQGNAVERLVPQDNLRALQTAKEYIDDIISGAHPDAAEIPPSSKARLEWALVDAKQQLLAAGDAASGGAYKTARDTFEAGLKPAIEAGESVVGTVARKTGEGPIARVASEMFSLGERSPGSLRRLKAAITSRPDGVELWDDLVRSHLDSVFARIRQETQKGPKDLGNALSQALYGTPGAQQALRIALDHRPGMADTMASFFGVLRRTSALFQSGSWTEPLGVLRRQMEQDLGSRAGRLAQADVSGMLLHPLAPVGRIWDRLTRERNTRWLFDALANPATAAELGKLRRLSPRSELYLRRAAAVLAMVAEEGAMGETRRALAGDMPIPTEPPGTPGQRPQPR